MANANFNVDTAVAVRTGTTTRVAVMLAVATAAASVGVALGVGSSLSPFLAIGGGNKNTNINGGVNTNLNTNSAVANPNLVSLGKAFVRGNANDDGFLDKKDIDAISSWMQQSVPLPCPDAADVDDNGRIDITDVVYLSSYLNMGGNAPKSPFPSRGVDPTSDKLGCKPVPELVSVGDRFVRGDASDDGYVDDRDADAIDAWQWHGGVIPCLDAADTDDNGRIDINDTVYLNNYLHLGGAAPVSPYPGLGVDPTVDALGCKPVTAGRLNVAFTGIPPAQSVNAGTKNFEAAQLLFNLGTSTPTVSVTGLTLRVASQGALPSVAYGNLALYDGTTRIAIDTSTSTPPCDWVGCYRSFSISSSSPLVISGPRTLRVVGDVGPATTTATFTVSMANEAVRAWGADGTPIAVQYGATVSNQMTIIPTPQAKLNVAVTTMVRKEFIPGEQDVQTVNINLDARNSGLDVFVSEINVAVWVYNNADPGVYRNLELYAGTTRLVLSQPVQERCTISGCTYRFVFPTPLKVPLGSQKDLRLLGDIATGIDTAGSFMVAVEPGGVKAVDSNRQAVEPSYTTFVSEHFTFRSGGGLTISGLTANYPAGLLPGNTNGIEVGVFRLTSITEPIRVEKIVLSGDSTRPVYPSGPRASAFNQVRAIHLYDGATRLTPVNGIAPTATDRLDRATVLIDLTSHPIEVSTTSPKDITVKVDTNPVTRYPVASVGAPGQGFRLSVAGQSDVKALGLLSATTLPPRQITLSGATLNDWTVYVSVPTVTVYRDLPVSEKIGGSAALPRLSPGLRKDLYRFKIKADSAGDIYQFQVGFAVNEQKVTTTNFVIVDANGTQLAATTTAGLTFGRWPGGRMDIYHLWFTSDGLRPSGGRANVAPYRILAGTSKLLTLKGDITCWRDNGCASAVPSGSLSISFLGDTGFPALWGSQTIAYPESAYVLYADTRFNRNRFIWSDMSISGPFGITSPTALTDKQWTNGYRVQSTASPNSRLPATTTDVTFAP
ncbi:MAG: hypothetical protein PHI63_02735 [Patescibacteria group bacterium]|nr:hypothetical protein [Patescibacteria group bacterium]